MRSVRYRLEIFFVTISANPMHRIVQPDTVLVSFSVMVTVSYIQVIVVAFIHAKFFNQHLRLPQPSTVKDALEACCVLENFPLEQIPESSVGIYGCIVKLAQVLKNNDRIEIYRSLAKDANLARLERAIRQKILSSRK